jgi:hypothetical protein
LVHLGRETLAQDFAGGTEIQDFLKEKDIAYIPGDEARQFLPSQDGNRWHRLGLYKVRECGHIQIM